MRALRTGLFAASTLLLVLTISNASGAAFLNGGRDKVTYVDGGGGLSSTSTVTGGTNQDQAGPGLSNPAWSSDGTNLAYDNGVSLWVNGANTGIPGANPAWSPGGHTLVYERGGDIWCAGYPTPGSSPSCLGGTDLGSSGVDPTVSPDGTKIAFAQTPSASSQIVVMNANGSSPTVVPGQSGSNRSPSWSPSVVSGSQPPIAFESNRGGTWQIYTMDSSGGSLTQITTDSTDDHHPAWSPDGLTIAFDNGGTIKTVSAFGGAPSTEANVAVGTNPDWRDSAPINLSAPSVSPVPTTVGQILVVSTGTWNGSQSNGWAAFAFQWQRSVDNGVTWADIVGQTSATYTVQSGDLGAGILLRVLVTATDALGSTTAIGTPAPPQPVNVAIPTASGTPSADLGFLFATTGTWTGAAPITYTFQWLRCFGHTDGHCEPIPGATSSFYSPTGDDIDTQLNVAVTATNAFGSAVAYSAATPYITGTPPHDHVSPTISGVIEVGSALTTDQGFWYGSVPMTFTYQWRICLPDGSNCNSIPGATGTSYTLQPSDYGSTIRIMVRARNGAGFGVGVSNHTFPIRHKTLFGPATSQGPALAGPARVGAILVGSEGTWTGEAPITFTDGWQRCDATGGSCVTIAGQKKTTYRVRPQDAGATIRFQVTARNIVNIAIAASTASGAIVTGQKKPKGRRLVGTTAADYLAGGAGDDRILGLGGNDTLLGGAGDDYIDGGAGNDVITGGPGSDTLLGGPGSDTIYAADGERDTVDCGTGNDRAYVDTLDVVRNCEVVTILTPAPPAAARSGGSGAAFSAIP